MEGANVVDAKILQGIDFFDGLSGSELKQIAEICQVVKMKKGERIFSRGDEAEKFYVVKTGKVNLTFQVSILLSELDIVVDMKREGGTFGWSALVPPYKLTLSAYCDEDCDLIQVQGKDVLSLCARELHIGFVLMSNLAEVIGSRMNQLQVLYEKEIEINVPSFGGRGRG
jgi:CRP-like cAMP-binding protein